MRIIVIIILSLLTSSVFSQTKAKYLYFQAADKSVSLYPFYKIVDNNFYPAFTVGAEIEYRHKNKSVVSQTLETTGYSHKMIGSGITTTTSIVYRFQTEVGFFAETMFGIGTTIFAPVRENYSLNENEMYELNKNPIHIVLAVPIDIGLGYQSGKFTFYGRYRYMVEYPYIKLLPVLPTALLSIGVKYKLNF